MEHYLSGEAMTRRRAGEADGDERVLRARGRGDGQDHQGAARDARAPGGGAGRRRHHLPGLSRRRRVPAYARRLLGLPELDGDAAPRHREPAPALHPRGARGPSDLTETLPDASLDQLFREARTRNAWHDKDVPDALLHEHRRSREARTDVRQLQPGALRLRQIARGEGAAEAASLGRQPRQDHEGAGLRHHRLRPRLLRASAEAVSAHRRQELVRRQAARRSPTPPSATARCKAPISSWRRGRSGSIAARCRASTMRASTGISSPAPSVKSNFLCNLGYGDDSRPAGRARRASPSTRWRASFKKPPMNILALDTSMGACSAAVLCADDGARAASCAARRDAARPRRGADADGGRGAWPRPASARQRSRPDRGDGRTRQLHRRAHRHRRRARAWRS